MCKNYMQDNYIREFTNYININGYFYFYWKFDLYNRRNLIIFKQYFIFFFINQIKGYEYNISSIHLGNNCYE